MSLTRALLGPACVLMTTAGAALAQSDASDDVLRGPRVNQQRAPGTERPFAESPRQRAGQQGQMQSLMQGIRSLNRQDAPESVRLSREQMAELRDVFAQLRRGNPPQADAPEGMQEDRPRRRGGRSAQPESTDAAPRPSRRDAAASGSRPAQPADQMAGVAAGVWQILNDEQRAYLRANRDAPFREAAPRAGGRAPAWLDELPTSLRDRLDEMSVEERAVLWSRLDRALGDRQRRGGAGSDRAAPGTTDRRSDEGQRPARQRPARDR